MVGSVRRSLVQRFSGPAPVGSPQGITECFRLDPSPLRSLEEPVRARSWRTAAENYCDSQTHHQTLVLLPLTRC